MRVHAHHPTRRSGRGASVALAVMLGACGGPGSSAGGNHTAHESATAHVPVDLPTPSQYRVQLAEGGGSLAVTLWLDPQDGPQPADLPQEPGRAARRDQVQDVRCDDQAVEAGSDGWTLPGGCGALQYSVRLVAPPDGGVDPNAFASFHDAEAGHWLLTGGGLFLVPESMNERPTLDLRGPAGVTAHHLLPESSGLGHVLPAPSQLGRVLIGLGRYHVVERSDGATTMKHLFDREVTIDLEGLPMGIRYLVDTTGEPAPRSLHVYWLGRPRGSAPRLGGTAALDSMVVSYWTDLPEDASTSVRRAPIAVFLQQYFVVLTGARIPAWVSTSLGQYYALKAWKETGAIDQRELRAIIASSVPRDAQNPGGSVREAHARWVDTGHDDDYRTFYRLGLGFWVALDEHIRDATDREKNLDAVLPELLGLIYDEDGAPPMRFLRALEEAGAADAGTVTRRWLDWPTES